MFYCVFDFTTLCFEKLTDSYIYHKNLDSECYFIGEVLSSEEETYQGFLRFIADQDPHHLLFFRGNYQVFVRISCELWIFSDLGNVRPIFYTKQNSEWLFSSHLRPLAQVVRSPIYVPWFQRSLKSSGFHLDFDTPFYHIKNIQGGFGFHLRKDHSRIFQSWNIDRDEKLSWQTAQHLLKEELTASVLLRMKNKKVTTDLSGGLDSSTITWIAAGQKPVKSITVVGKEEDQDVKVAKSVASAQPNIYQELFTQEQIPTIYSDMINIHTDTPIPFLWSANKASKKLLWTKQMQSDIHFSGEGGDTVLGAAFTYLVDLIRQGNWKTFYSHARDWAQYKKQSTFSWVVGSLLLAANLPFKPKIRHPLVSSHNQADWLRFSTKIKKSKFSNDRGVSETILGIHYLGHVSYGLRDLANQIPVKISFPYLDHNVLRTCLRTPSELKMDPHELKPLLKRAFQSDLPSSLLSRNSKGNYTSDVYLGMESNYSLLQEYFKEMRLAELGLVDMVKFKKCFQRLLIGAPIKLPEFNQTLSLELWLQQIEKEGLYENPHS